MYTVGSASTSPSLLNLTNDASCRAFHRRSSTPGSSSLKSSTKAHILFDSNTRKPNQPIISVAFENSTGYVRLLSYIKEKEHEARSLRAQALIPRRPLRKWISRWRENPSSLPAHRPAGYFLHEPSSLALAGIVFTFLRLSLRYLASLSTSLSSLHHSSPTSQCPGVSLSTGIKRSSPRKRNSQHANVLLKKPLSHEYISCTEVFYGLCKSTRGIMD
ncbi:hypothetical protein E2C01_021294 [Portunus trituberculatus]|uniref:Uncharacterized protein n=1 Tax=Portunus trituberculatus TaxID=210409 RepID=A0A5B7E3U5_PORTR|nr:hypothetical protein [Portunus trituberculatus]